MIITRLAGGLGNQMFQYAAARNFLREGEKFYLDTYLLPQIEEEDIEKVIHRPYALSIFNNLKAGINEIKMFKLLRSKGLIDSIKRKIFLNNCVIFEQRNTERVEYPAGFETEKNKWFIGNFQSEKFFKNIRQELLQEFNFPEMDPQNAEINKKIIDTSDAVSIHIRRGDYLSAHHKNVHNSVTMEYYEKAIQFLLNKLGLTYLYAFVFTDDIKWAKENFAPANLHLTYIYGNTGKNSWKDMFLMTSCKHHIIANSSFSWWGAWLSWNQGINIAPKHWFMPDTYEYDIYDIVPKHWKIVDYNINNEAV